MRFPNNFISNLENKYDHDEQSEEEKQQQDILLKIVNVVIW